MSLASQIVAAIRQARNALGDLVQRAELLKANREYVNGQVVNTPISQPIDVAHDKLTYEEQIESQNEYEVKLIVFNLQGDVTVSLQDKILYQGKTYGLAKVEPQVAGTQIPAYVVMLKS